jgi:dihydroneopterin aldolase
MPDILYVKDLRIQTTIGVLAWERGIKQWVSIDFEMVHDIRQAAKTDCLDDTINYQDIGTRLIEFVGQSEFNLIETLAEQCANIILNEFGVSWVRLRASKPMAVAQSQDSGVIIERGISNFR